MRLLAKVFNAFPVRWQRRFMTAAHDRFLVGITGLGVDDKGQVLLARHRFGAPQWRFLGGFLHPRERVEDALAREIREETGLVIEVGPVLEVVTGSPLGARRDRVRLPRRRRHDGPHQRDRGAPQLPARCAARGARRPARAHRAPRGGRDRVGTARMRVQRIDHVVLTVADIERTIAFYRARAGHDRGLVRRGKASTRVRRSEAQPPSGGPRVRAKGRAADARRDRPVLHDRRAARRGRGASARRSPSRSSSVRWTRPARAGRCARSTSATRTATSSRSRTRSRSPRVRQ